MIMDFGVFFKEMLVKDKKFCVFGNLFYNILILLMFYFFDYVYCIEDMYFMF